MEISLSLKRHPSKNACPPEGRARGGTQFPGRGPLASPGAAPGGVLVCWAGGRQEHEQQGALLPLSPGQLPPSPGKRFPSERRQDSDLGPAPARCSPREPSRPTPGAHRGDPGATPQLPSGGGKLITVPFARGLFPIRARNKYPLCKAAVKVVGDHWGQCGLDRRARTGRKTQIGAPACHTPDPRRPSVRSLLLRMAIPPPRNREKGVKNVRRAPRAQEQQQAIPTAPVCSCSQPCEASVSPSVDKRVRRNELLGRPGVPALLGTVDSRHHKALSGGAAA